MQTCAGCGGRNPPELAVCPFCEYPMRVQPTVARWLRPTLATLLLLAVVLSAVLVMLTRPGLFT